MGAGGGGGGGGGGRVGRGLAMLPCNPGRTDEGYIIRLRSIKA